MLKNRRQFLVAWFFPVTSGYPPFPFCFFVQTGSLCAESSTGTPGAALFWMLEWQMLVASCRRCYFQWWMICRSYGTCLRPPTKKVCSMFRLDSPYWYHGWGQDPNWIFQALKETPRIGCFKSYKSLGVVVCLLFYGGFKSAGVFLKGSESYSSQLVTFKARQLHAFMSGESTHHGVQAAIYARGWGSW